MGRCRTKSSIDDYQTGLPKGVISYYFGLKTPNMHTGIRTLVGDGGALALKIYTRTFPIGLHNFNSIQFHSYFKPALFIFLYSRFSSSVYFLQFPQQPLMFLCVFFCFRLLFSLSVKTKFVLQTYLQLPYLSDFASYGCIICLSVPPTPESGICFLVFSTMRDRDTSTRGPLFYIFPHCTVHLKTCK